jgi:hypothetical protein
MSYYLLLVITNTYWFGISNVVSFNNSQHKPDAPTSLLIVSSLLLVGSVINEQQTLLISHLFVTFSSPTYSIVL